MRQGGVNLDVELISFDEWSQRKGKVAPYLPYITMPDGAIMLETTVIMKQLGAPPPASPPAFARVAARSCASLRRPHIY